MNIDQLQREISRLHPDVLGMLAVGGLVAVVVIVLLLVAVSGLLGSDR